MATAKIDGIEIPRVIVQRRRPRPVGDRTSSAKGKQHWDGVAVKYDYDIETTVIPKAQRDALMDHLDSIMYGLVDFWLSEFGDESNTVPAFVTVNRDERSRERPSDWELSLTIEQQ